MAKESQDDARTQLVRLLLDKIDEDLYPSGTMLDMVEEIVTPDEVPAYVEVLMSKLRGEQFPSIAMLRRVKALG